MIQKFAEHLASPVTVQIVEIHDSTKISGRTLVAWCSNDENDEHPGFHWLCEPFIIGSFYGSIAVWFLVSGIFVGSLLILVDQNPLLCELAFRTFLRLLLQCWTRRCCGIVTCCSAKTGDRLVDLRLGNKQKWSWWRNSSANHLLCLFTTIMETTICFM